MKLHVEKWFGKCSGNDNTGSCFLHEMCWNANRLIFSLRKTGGKMSLLWSKWSSEMICSLCAPISETAYVHVGQTFSLINSSLHIPRYLVMEDWRATLSTPQSLRISPHLGQPEHTQRNLWGPSDFDLNDQIHHCYHSACDPVRGGKKHLLSDWCRSPRLNRHILNIEPDESTAEGWTLCYRITFLEML